MVETKSNLLVRYSDAVASMVTDSFFISSVANDLCISKDDYINILNTIFKNELEYVPHDTERHMFLNSFAIQLSCRICEVKFSITNYLGVCVSDVNKHIVGRKHQHNVEKFGKYFKEDADDDDDEIETCPVPSNLMTACFAEVAMDHKRYFKGVVLPNISCQLCDHKITKTKDMVVLRTTIDNHVYGRNHTNLYFKKFPRCNYKLMSYTDAMNESIGYLHSQSETILSIEMYKSVLDTIYESEKFNLVMLDSLKSVRIFFKFQLYCMLCECVLTSRAETNIDNVLKSHIEGKSHKKRVYKSKSVDGSFKFTEDIKESPNAIKFSRKVMQEFTKMNFHDYTTKVENVVTFNVEFDVHCMICNKNVIRSKYIGNVQNQIDCHMYCKNHINHLLEKMYN